MEKLVEIAIKNIENEKGTISRILLELSLNCKVLRNLIFPFFQKLSKLEFSEVVEGVLSDESIEEKFSSLPPLLNLEGVYFSGSAKLSEKTVELVSKLAPNAKRIELANFWNLKSLSCVCGMKQLRQIQVGPSLLDSNTFAPLSNLPSLQSLVIKRCSKLEALPSLPSLTSLTIKNCSLLTHSIQTEVTKRKFPRLLSLSIPLSNICDEQLETISTDFAEQLEALCVDYSKKLSNKGIKNSVERLSKLTEFSARNLPLLDSNLEIEWPSSLHTLEFKRSEGVGDKALLSLSKNCLKRLDVNFTRVSDFGIITALKNSFESLQVVCLKGCGKISSKLKDIICSNCTNLEEIDIDNISFEILSKLSTQNLVSFSLSNTLLSSIEYEKLFPRLSRLTSLRLLFCNTAEEASLRSLSLNCTQLKIFHIADKKLNDKVAQHFQKLHPKLEELDISGCVRLSWKGLSLMLENARISKLRAVDTPSLGNYAYSVLNDKCGFFLKKIEATFLPKRFNQLSRGSSNHFNARNSSESNEEEMQENLKPFFFPNLLSFKAGLSDFVVRSLVNLQKLKKIVAVESLVYNHDLSLLAFSPSVEFFSSINPFTLEILNFSATFLKEWSSGPIASTLRYLILPVERVDENKLQWFQDFKSLVFFPLQHTKCSLSAQKEFISEHMPLLDPNFCFKRDWNKENESNFRSTVRMFSRQEKLLPIYEGKIAVVTRANFELQASTVRRLSLLGFTVYALYDETNITEEFSSLLLDLKHEKMPKNTLIFPIACLPTDKSCVEKALETIKSIHSNQPHQFRIDLLICGPYALGHTSYDSDHSLSSINPQNLLDSFPQFVLATLFILQVFENVIIESKDTRVIVLSNRMGSIQDNISGRIYLIRMALASLHQMVRNVAIEWKKKSNVILTVLFPGLIRTGSKKKTLLSTITPIDFLLNLKKRSCILVGVDWQKVQMWEQRGSLKSTQNLIHSIQD